MEKRAFGKTGMQVSLLGFGGAEIGYQHAPQADVEALLQSALDAGLNVIDTAECYAGSEEKIGKAIAHRRSDFHLFTKCGHGETYMEARWSKKDIEKSIETSLKRLQTDYVDLVQLHSCDERELKKGEVIEALLKAKEAGKTRFIGYSGDAQAALYAINTGVFDSLQTSVSIADQEALELTLPKAIEKNMGVIAKRPIANASWRSASRPAEEYIVPYWERLQELKYDFINGNPAETVERALRFTASVPGICTMIVGTTKPGRWQDNAALVAKGKLPEDEFEAIRRRWKEIAKKDWVGQI
ncbi:MAG TPA: aldo/keto reductase [Chroococcales cyanobacterium]